MPALDCRAGSKVRSAGNASHTPTTTISVSSPAAGQGDGRAPPLRDDAGEQVPERDEPDRGQDVQRHDPPAEPGRDEQLQERVRRRVVGDLAGAEHRQRDQRQRQPARQREDHQRDRTQQQAGDHEPAAAAGRPQDRHGDRAGERADPDRGRQQPEARRADAQDVARVDRQQDEVVEDEQRRDARRAATSARTASARDRT